MNFLKNLASVAYNLRAWGRSSAGEHLLCTQGVRGSNPLVSTTPHLERGFAILPSPNSPKKQRLTTLHEAADAPLLTKRVGCTEAWHPS